MSHSRVVSCLYNSPLYLFESVHSLECVAVFFEAFKSPISWIRNLNKTQTYKQSNRDQSNNTETTRRETAGQPHKMGNSLSTMLSMGLITVLTPFVEGEGKPGDVYWSMGAKFPSRWKGRQIDGKWWSFVLDESKWRFLWHCNGHV